jgi:hypothetical protein
MVTVNHYRENGEGYMVLRNHGDKPSPAEVYEIGPLVMG